MKEFPHIVEAEEIRKFVRCEISYEEMTNNSDKVVFDDYIVVLEDFRAAFNVLKKNKVNRKDFIENWFVHVFMDLYSILDIHRFEITRNKELLYNDNLEMMYCIYVWCDGEHERYAKYHQKKDIPDYKAILKSIDTYYANLDLEPDQRKYTIPMKVATIKAIGNPRMINSASKTFIKIFKKFVNDLCKSNCHYAYRVKTYSYLMGSICFPQNKELARITATKLYEMSEDPFIAEILGDLYYSGTENTPPSYACAYQYYSISALDGNKVSILKMADMLSRGKGVPKNEHVGKMMVFNLFEDAYNSFCRYEYDSMLADVAVRMGMIYDSGIDTESDALEAAKYYNIARYAIKKRINMLKNPADESLLDDVDRRFRELSKVIGSNPNASYVFSEVPNLLLTAMDNRYVIYTTVSKTKNEYKLVTRRVPKINEDNPLGMLIEYPLNEYCALVDLVEEYVPVKGTRIWLKNKEDSSFYADDLFYDKDKKQCIFKYKGVVVARISTSVYSCRLKQEGV